jgi:N-glycosylase/DNA lyase
MVQVHEHTNLGFIVSSCSEEAKKDGVEVKVNDGDEDDAIRSEQVLYTFPSVEALGSIKEEKLRQLGFGYRAKYLVGTGKLLQERGGTAYMQSLLTSNDRAYVFKELTGFPGVGPKGAYVCVC